MMKVLRRVSWFSLLYLRRYGHLIAISLALSLAVGLLGRAIWPRLPHPKPKVHIGVVGNFTPQRLPSVVNEILKSGLTTIDEQMQVVGNLASNWSVEEDKIYTFQLRPGLVWPDGRPAVAEEIKLNIPGVMVEYPAADKIRFILPEKFAPFPAALSYPVLNEQGQTLTGFTVSVTETNSGGLKTIQLETKDKLLLIRIFNTSSEAITAFKLGQVDALMGLLMKSDVSQGGRIRVEEKSDQSRVVGLFMNMSNPLLADKNLRQALAYLIEDKTWGGQRALSSIHPASWAFNPLVKNYAFDPARGRDLLTKALPEGEDKISLELATLPDYIEQAESIRDQLGEYVEIAVKVVNGAPEDYQLFLGTFEIPVDPDQYQFWHSTQRALNVSRLVDEKADKLLEDGRTTFDQKERKAIYLEFQKTLAEEMPVLFLYYPKEYTVVRGDLELGT